MAPALEVNNLTVKFGPVVAVNDVSLSVDPGSVVGVVGANGAGKSSLLNGIMGSVKATTGRVAVGGQGVPYKRRPYRMARLGLAYVPEGRRILSPLTVEENLLLAAETGGGDRSAVGEVYELFSQLGGKRTQLAGSLSGGEQQMLAIGRALVSRPSCILMDEPSMGLAPIVIEEIYGLLSERHNSGTIGMSFLLAEQSLSLATRVSDHVLVMSLGQIVMSGSPEMVTMHRRELESAYLGEVDIDFEKARAQELISSSEGSEGEDLGA